MKPEFFNEKVENDEINYFATQLIDAILDIPGVKEAVTLQACKAYAQSDMRELHNNFNVMDLDTLPNTYIWNQLSNNV